MEPSEGSGLTSDGCWSVHTLNFSWSSSSVTRDALHNLTFPCPYGEYDKAEAHLVSPATFFIQVLRLALSLCLLIFILAFYNCVNVLGTNVYSTATCSLHWVLFMALIAVKALLLVVLVPVSTRVDREGSSDVNQAGFIIVTVVQSAVVFVLFISLDHERQFRSPDFASADSPFRRRCITPTWKRLLFSWYRVAMATVILVSLFLLVAIEITFTYTNHSSAPSSLVWVFIVFLILPRFGILAMTVLLLRAKSGLSPTVMAKVYLVCAVAFSLMEDLPSSVLNVAPNYPCHGGACLLRDLTLYDFFQAVGGVSLLFFTLFVRSQYLRVEEECKLAMVWDFQKVLQVNGRRDIVTH